MLARSHVKDVSWIQVVKHRILHGKHKAVHPRIRWEYSVGKDVSEWDLDILWAEHWALDKPDWIITGGYFWRYLITMMSLIMSGLVFRWFTSMIRSAHSFRLVALFRCFGNSQDFRLDLLSRVINQLPLYWTWIFDQLKKTLCAACSTFS